MEDVVRGWKVVVCQAGLVPFPLWGPSVKVINPQIRRNITQTDTGLHGKNGLPCYLTMHPYMISVLAFAPQPRLLSQKMQTKKPATHSTEPWRACPTATSCCHLARTTSVSRGADYKHTASFADVLWLLLRKWQWVNRNQPIMVVHALTQSCLLVTSRVFQSFGIPYVMMLSDDRLQCSIEIPARFRRLLCRFKLLCR